MQPNEATFLREFLLTAYESEIPATKKVIGTVPSANPDYKPSEKSMSAIELCWHIASAEVWFLNSIADLKFPTEGGQRPGEIRTPADVLKWYDDNQPKALARVKAMTSEQLTQVVDFYGVIQMPVVAYLSFCNSHSVHHRGQLSVYLRPMGGKVPSIYGGSADEPFQM